MATIETDKLIKALNWRYAVKKFDATKKISAGTWATIEESLRLSASSYGLQPWKFLVIDNPEMRKKLTPASYGQTQVESASHFVVLTTLKTMDQAYVEKFLKSVAETRGIPVESLDGYKKVILGDLVAGPRAAHLQAWAQRQVYIAMGNALTCAALLEVDTVPMEGLDPAKYDEILGLKNTPYATVAAIAFGYRHADDGLQHAKKARFGKADVIQHI